MSTFQFTPQQYTVLDALAAGASITQAAAEAGVHRNTISNWRRETFNFEVALTNAQYDRAQQFREKAEEMTDLAFDTLRGIMSDSKASPSVRLRAALAVVKLVTAQMPPQKHPDPSLANEMLPKRPEDLPPDSDLENVHNLHNSAQQPPVAPVQTIRREHPKIGRNDVCSCGSGLKYKRCCLGKSQEACDTAA